MKRLLTALVVAAFGVALAVPAAFAQSSGSFNYASNANNMTGCVITQSNGQLTGGVLCGNSSGAACTTNADCPSSGTCTGAVACTSTTDCPNSGTCDIASGLCSNSGTCTIGGAPNCDGSATIGIKTNSGNGNVFDVRPSAVIGLFTDAKINSKQSSSSSSSYAGVNFQVTVGSQPSKSNADVTPNYPITYAAQFIQISTNLFQGLQANCMSSAGGCYIEFTDSTVSAHSFDWIVSPLTSGNYSIGVNWTSALANSGIADSMACVGPVNITVEQNKVFTPSSKLSNITF